MFCFILQWNLFFCVGIQGALDFSIFSILNFEYWLSSGGSLLFFVIHCFCKRCVYLFITLVPCFVCFGCAGSVRISLAGRVIYFLCGTPLCGVPGLYDLIWALSWSGWRDCKDFLFSGYVVAGTVRLKWWGCGLFSFQFSVCFSFLAGGCVW